MGDELINFQDKGGGLRQLLNTYCTDWNAANPDSPKMQLSHAIRAAIPLGIQELRHQQRMDAKLTSGGLKKG